MSGADDGAELIASPNPFAMVSYELLKLSANAIKLYIILSKYADNRTGRAWPGRATLAADLGYKQPRAVDAAIKELEEAGAVTVTRTMKPGAKTRETNVYTVKRAHEITSVQPAPTSAPQCTTPPEGLVHSDALGSAQECTRVVHPSAHELRTQELTSEELISSAPADAEPVQGVLVGMPADPDGVRASEAREIATILGERHPVLKSKFMAMAKMAERAMKSYGAPMGVVGQTMERIFMDGCTPTDVMIGQRLEGIIRGGARPTKDDLIRKTMAMATPPAGATAPALTADPFQLRITS